MILRQYLSFHNKLGALASVVSNSIEDLYHLSHSRRFFNRAARHDCVFS